MVLTKADERFREDVEALAKAARSAKRLSAQQWKPLGGHERDYSISDHGRIRRDTPGRGTSAGRILSVCWTACNPEPRVCISRDGKRVLIAVHRAMVEAFVRPLQKGEIVVPRDGDMRDLNLSNWVIRSASVRVGMAWRTRYNTTKPKPPAVPKPKPLAFAPPPRPGRPRPAPPPQPAPRRPAATGMPALQVAPTRHYDATATEPDCGAPFRSGMVAWEQERELRRAGRW